jgi:hypothetical protein
MERKTWSVHFVMETADNVVQNSAEGTKKASKKKRSQADKVGKFKHLLQKNRETAKDIAEIKLMLRTLLNGMKSSLHYDQPTIEKFSCKDEIDREILQVLFEAGSPGLLPKDIAIKLQRFRITRHHVSRRLRRMNKRLQKQIKESVAEQHGWHWTLTSFAFEAYGATEEDLQNANAFSKSSEEGLGIGID